MFPQWTLKLCFTSEVVARDRQLEGNTLPWGHMYRLATSESKCVTDTPSQMDGYFHNVFVLCKVQIEAILTWTTSAMLTINDHLSLVYKISPIFGLPRMDMEQLQARVTCVTTCLLWLVYVWLHVYHSSRYLTKRSLVFDSTLDDWLSYERSLCG